jgi:hypothetical protein
VFVDGIRNVGETDFLRYRFGPRTSSDSPKCCKWSCIGSRLLLISQFSDTRPAPTAHPGMRGTHDDPIDIGFLPDRLSLGGDAAQADWLDAFLAQDRFQQLGQFLPLLRGHGEERLRYFSRVGRLGYLGQRRRLGFALICSATPGDIRNTANLPRAARETEATVFLAFGRASNLSSNGGV